MADAGFKHSWYDEFGVPSLAATPAISRPDLWSSYQSDWPDTRMALEQRLYALRNWRLSWWEHWARLAEAILPRRYHWLIVPNTMTRGLAINQMIKDPTGAQAVRVCTAGLRDGVMSSSRPWFRLKAGLRNFKPDRAAKLWFQEVEDRAYRVFKGSNYYACGTQMFEDLTVFGTAPKIMYGDRQSVIRCYNPCAGEYFLGCGADFRIDSLYRTFNLTVMQCVGMFGLDNCGDTVKGLWDQKGSALEQEVIVAHAIEPNFGLAQPGQINKLLGVVPGGFPYREVYWLWGQDTPRPLRMQGYRRKPFIAPRWATTSNDAYGRSPGMDALPDILQLHTMTMRQAEAIEKMVRPPMLAHVGLKNQPTSILPGKVTFTDDISKGMKPVYEVKPEIEEMSQLIEKIEARVGKWFFNDLFQMMDNLEGVQPRNQMEISERRGEKLQVLGPVVENMTAELEEDVLHTLEIMGRRGLLPPKPQSLLGVPLDIEFDTMISIAQRGARSAVMERGMNVLGTINQQFPMKRVGDNVDFDAWFREYADLTQIPIDTLTDEKEMQAQRQAEDQAAQAAQQHQQMMEAAAKAAPGLAKAAKDASAAGPSASGGPAAPGSIDTGGGLNALQIMSGFGGASSGATGLLQ
jgi:hypothetical protein